MAQALVLPVGPVGSPFDQVLPGCQEPFGRPDLTDGLFPAFKSEYVEDLDGGLLPLGADLPWDSLFDDGAPLDASTPLASLSDDSDDTLLPDSSSSSSLDSNVSGGAGGVIVALPLVAPAAAAPALPPLPHSPRRCRLACDPSRPWQPARDGRGASLTREQRVLRYLEKRKRRTFEKTIRYEARRAYAEVRPRIKGRFATKAEVAAMKAAAAAGVPYEC